MPRRIAVIGGPGLVAITLAELNPRNAAADDRLLERSPPHLLTPSADGCTGNTTV